MSVELVRHVKLARVTPFSKLWGWDLTVSVVCSTSTALWVNLEKAMERFKIAKGEVSWLHMG